MPVLLPEGKQSYETAAGAPLVGGKVYTYDAGTNTPRTTYSDSAGASPNGNPVILDARGEASIFWSGSYKVILADSLDNVIWTVDNVTSSLVGALVATTITASGAVTLAGPLIVPTIGPTALQQHTVPAIASDTLALLTATQTMGNKTLTTPVIAAILTNAGAATLTLPLATDTLVGRQSTDTLTNKTITGIKTASTVNDSTDAAAFAVGYRHIPQNRQTGNYTLVLADNAKHIYCVNVGAQTITIPTNASVAFDIGTCIPVVNNGTTAVTISTTGLTAFQAGTVNTGNRTLAVRGEASLFKVDTDTWAIGGAGLT